MVDIQSKEVIDKISEELKVQPSLSIPRELMKQIQLVYNVNPEKIITAKDASASDATTGIIMTASSTKRTFITAITLSVSKDAVNDSTQTSVTITPIGKGVKAALLLRYEPTTAGEHQMSISLSSPIEIEKGSNVSLNNSAATASIDASSTIYFYEVDPL